MSGRMRGWLAALALVWAMLPVAAQTRVEYIHTDLLGSVVAITDEAGAVIERREYEPYGAQLTPTLRDGPGYTGHVQDAATGLVYMQQRYYDPMIGKMLSVDPVTAYSSGDMRHFNPYAYANNNPYRFTDPDGRLSRGTGWSDREWRQFDRAQQSAAGSLEKAVSKLNSAMSEGGKALQRAEKTFERNFGAGSATPQNMTQVASDMSAMAVALRDTSVNAIPAHGMTGAQINAQYGAGGDTLAGVPTTGPKMVVVNTTHASFNDSARLAWGAGHETGHAVLGYKDQFFNGDTAYKFGTPQQQNTFKTLPSQQRLINPDHIMDQAR